MIRLCFRNIQGLYFQLFMIKVIAYILNLFAPLVNILGAIGMLASISVGDMYILPIGGALFLVGIVFGIFAYKLDIPPRWFWAKSVNELFEFSVTAVLGYAWNFASWGFTVYLVDLVINW